MGPRRGGGTTVAMRDARCGEGRQLIRRGGMHVGRQRRRLASLGPERRVDFYPENPPTAGSLVSNYRNAVALGHSCLAPLSSPTFPTSPPFAKFIIIFVSAVSFIEQTYLSPILNSVSMCARKLFYLKSIWLRFAQLQSIWMEITEGQCTLWWIPFWNIQVLKTSSDLPN